MITSYSAPRCLRHSQAANDASLVSWTKHIQCSGKRKNHATDFLNRTNDEHHSPRTVVWHQSTVNGSLCFTRWQQNMCLAM